MLDVTHQQPDRSWAVASSVVLGLVLMVFGFVVAGVIDEFTSLIGIVIVLAVTSFAVTPMLRYRHQTRQRDVIPIGHLSRRWQQLLTDAVDAENRIDRARRAAPDGPLTEHLDSAVATARRYVWTLAASAELQTGSTADAAVIDHELHRLADAATDLVRAAAPRGPEELRELIERTELITDALESNELGRPG